MGVDAMVGVESISGRVIAAVRNWAVPVGAVIGILAALGALTHWTVQQVVADDLRDIRAQIEAVEHRLAQRIDVLERRIDAVEHRLEAVEHRLEAVEMRLDAVERRIDAVEHRLEAVEMRLDGLERRIDDFERRIDTRMDEFGETLARIEGIVTSMRDAREVVEPVVESSFRR